MATVSSKPQKITLPDLLANCPFTLSVNPHYARCRAESSAWIESFNFFLDPHKRLAFYQADSERLCAYAYPYANYEGLRICCDFVNLLFTIDEISDTQTGEGAKATGDVFLDVFNGKEVVDSELSRMSYQ